MSQEIVLASGNAGKLKELSELLQPFGCTLRPQSDFNIPEAEENGLSFLENSLIKARHASRLSGLPAIADDSGISVPALGGEPGIYSARYSPEGTAAANNLRLLDAMKTLTGTDRNAFFYCVLSLVKHGEDPVPLISQGAWHGQIAESLSGEKGFGYDPLFYLPELNKTVAELSREEKNALSHRGKAMQHLIPQLNDWLT